MANSNSKIGRTEVLLWPELTPRGTASAAKITKDEGYDERHTKALKFVQKAAAAFEPIQMTALERAVESSRGTTRRVLVRLCVDGLVSLHGLSDPSVPAKVLAYVAEHSQSDEPETEPEPAA